MNHIDSYPQSQPNLEDAFFPVELRGVWVPTPSLNKNQRPDKLSELMLAPKHHAIVDVEKKHVFAVVGNDYRLITNREAVELGRKCFQSVFQVTQHEDMEFFNLVMPKTRSFAHMDFVHGKASFDYFDKDPWSPFLRVTNSYNRTYSLKFELGFCRGICKNGLIAGKQQIEFKFSHSRLAAREPEVEFVSRAGEFLELEKKFIESLRNLQRYHVPTKYAWPLACKVLGFSEPEEDAHEKSLELWEMRKAHVNQLTESYFGTLGENGYAALNVLTDFATRPEGEISPEVRVNSLQTRCGSWIGEFINAIEDRSFTFEDYLGEYAKLAV